MESARTPSLIDPGLVFAARRQLTREPFDRVANVTRDHWGLVLSSLRLASAASNVVLVGPIATALRGHPTPPAVPRVGLIGRWQHQGQVLEQLMAAGAMMHGFDTAPQGHRSRERWLASDGAAVSVGWLLADRADEVERLIEVGDRLVVPGGGQVILPTAEVLRERAAVSPWPADRALVQGLDAVLAVRAEADDHGSRLPDWIVLDPAAAVADRSERPEHVALTIPFSGTLDPVVRRALASSLKPLTIRSGGLLSLRALTASALDASILVTAAAPAGVMDAWLSSGDLVAATVQAVDDAYRAVSRTPHPA